MTLLCKNMHNLICDKNGPSKKIQRRGRDKKKIIVTAFNVDLFRSKINILKKLSKMSNLSFNSNKISDSSKRPNLTMRSSMSTVRTFEMMSTDFNETLRNERWFSRFIRIERHYFTGRYSANRVPPVKKKFKSSVLAL